MLKFPKIQQFRNAVRVARQDPARWGGERLYLGTVKLHGTNAGVRVTPRGEVVPQSRNRVLTPDDDNCGFAAFAAEHTAAFLRLADAVAIACVDDRDPVECEAVGYGAADVVLFGEWCGEGIQKGVAVSTLPRRWVLFGAAILVGEQERFVDTTLFGLDDLDGYELPAGVELVHGGPLTAPVELRVDLTDPASCSRAVELVNEHTIRVEQRCPWSAERGAAGIGEGLVWRPAGADARHTDLWFKTKGGLHRTASAARRVVTLSADQHASIDSFVAAAVNDERVQQGLDHVREVTGREPSMQDTRTFITWVQHDVKTELADELEASGMTWAQVHKPVSAVSAEAWKRLVGG